MTVMWCWERCVRSVRRFRERGRTPDVVFATGDIAFSGKPGEYEIATVFFDALLDAAGLGRRHLFVIAGNHDVDRDSALGWRGLWPRGRRPIGISRLVLPVPI